MSLLFNVVFAAKASSTHHKIALDALKQLRGPAAPRWHDLFLKHHIAYLTGAKAPDTTFQDFKNHVLHVAEGYWGGAVESAGQWYARTVASLRAANWAEAIYNAGVVSHYYADPIHPFHTGQTEEEGKVHRPAEWSITKSYEALRTILEEELGGYPSIETPDGDDWLAEMVRRGAEASHPHYQTLLDHYDLDRGIKKPEAGLDRELKTCLARLIGHAVVGFARILERAFQEAAAEPPATSLVLESVLAALSVPVQIVARKLADVQERSLLQSIYEEVQLTGKAVFTLPEDDWTVRQLHAQEVLQTPLEVLNAQPAGPTGTQHGRQGSSRPSSPKPRPTARQSEPKPTLSVAPPVAEAVSPPPNRLETNDRQSAPAKIPLRSPVPVSRRSPEARASVPPPSRPEEFRLEKTSPIVDAPEIGPKTAARLQAVGINTVGDLLRCDPAAVVGRLRQRWITAEIVRQWQAEASLMCRVPELRGYEAQILVACGVTDPAELAKLSPDRMMERVTVFAESKAGQRVLRSTPTPSRERVDRWIAQAARARAI